MSIRRNLKFKRTLIINGISLITAFILFNGVAHTIALANSGTNKLSINKNEDIKYQFKDLNKLNYEELIKLIKQIKYNDVPELFQFSNESYEFFKDENRVEAIIKALEESGEKFTANNDEGIPTLIEFLRSGFYLGFYHKELNYLNDIKFKNKCLPAIKAIENNSNFKLGTDIQDNIVKYVGKFTGNGSLDKESINALRKILMQFNKNKDNYLRENEKKNAIYEILKNLDVFLSGELRRNKNNVQKTDIYGSIDLFLNELDNLTENIINIDKSNEWLTNNLIYFTGKFSKFRTNSDITKKVISECTKKSKYLSNIYLECIKTLEDNFNGEFLDGTSVEYDKKINEAKDKYLPKLYKFDDGKVIIKAGSRVSEEKIKRLYWASKEVKAQFMRVVGNDKPLEKGHADDILNIVIYNSPSEYKLNQKLYGYSTDNGGIYIEDEGAFFTYERSPQESTYTLEELFRHEFTHYLQGRYLVPGIWGKTDFYKNNCNKLTWYDEGTAEFFAGSTREEGVKPRSSIVNNLSSDKNKRQSAKEILHAKYGQWDFYNYGFAFADYMYEDNIENFKDINNFIINNDVDGYTKYIEKLSSDNKVNEAYQQRMDKLKGELDNLTVPLVSDEYIQYHGSKKQDDISKDIKNVINIDNINFTIEKSDLFDTFNLNAEYVNKSNGKIEDWKEINKIINNSLKELDKKQWSGYKTVTAYFTNYKVHSNGDYSCDVNFHGILKDKKDPTIEKSKNNKGSYSKIKNIEGTLSGANTAYNYSFEVQKEGDISIKVENPDNLHLSWYVKKNDEYICYPYLDSLENKFYADAGKYVLTVYDYSSKDKEGTFKINIEGNIREEKNDKEIKEKEYNNDIKHALEISNNTILNGTLDGDDNIDFFKFNIKENSQLNISVDTLGEEGVNWLLYDSKDLNKYILVANNINGKLQNAYNIVPGEYYLCVYKYSKDNKKKYKLNIVNN